MLSPESPHSRQANEARSYISFIEKRDGRQPHLSPEEARAAAVEYTRIVESTLIADTDFITGGLVKSLRLNAAFKDGSSLNLSILDPRLTRRPGAPKYEVDVNVIDTDGTSREVHKYVQAPAGDHVTRLDLHEDEVQRRKLAGPIIRQSGYRDPQDFEAQQRFIFEEEMRLNNQPVNAAEIGGLIGLIALAEPYRPAAQ